MTFEGRSRLTWLFSGRPSPSPELTALSLPSLTASTHSTWQALQRLAAWQRSIVIVDDLRRHENSAIPGILCLLAHWDALAAP